MEPEARGLPLPYTRWLVPTLFVVLGVFPVFMHLDTLPIRIWDEARQAVNALEMWENGNFLVTHFEGSPDMWSTKPPLLIWLQVALIGLLGPVSWPYACLRPLRPSSPAGSYCGSTSTR
jgi:4-amino-4-deoxy-L-arabinose transferase-like glycosyltransferase